MENRAAGGALVLNVAGAFLRPCGMTSHSQIISIGVLTAVNGILLSPDENLIKPICQIDCTENLAAGHGIQYHGFARDWRLSWGRGGIQLVKSIHNA